MMQHDIEQLLAPRVEQLGYELWGCEYLAKGHYALLRIYIDKPSGIGIADCETVSRQLSALLDVEDPIPGNYQLEISSPGIPRPLFKNEQFKRYIGHQVRIRLIAPMASKRTFVGIIVAVDDMTLILDVEGVQQDFLFSNVAKASLQAE